VPEILPELAMPQGPKTSLLMKSATNGRQRVPNPAKYRDFPFDDILLTDMGMTFGTVAWLLFYFFSFGVSSRADDGPPRLEVLRRIPHSGYSEGLDYHQGYLWHALPKKIVKIDPKDGAVVATFPPATDYSESIVWFQGKLWNVSFSDNGLYAGTLNGSTLKFSHKGTTPESRAWGIATDGVHLIVTGHYRSPKLYFLSPKDGKLVREITTPIPDLEDLAWDGEGLWTSTFTGHTGSIFRIDPKSGEVQGEFSLPNPQECPVIDGIAQDGSTLWVTGKECPSIYQVKRPLIRVRKVATPKTQAIKEGSSGK
jgi:glutamine cyclotransferase